MIVVYFAQQNYDAVHHESHVTHKVQPFYDNIDTAFDDCKTLEKALSKYRISEDDKHWNVWDVKFSVLEKYYKQIDEILNGNKDKNYLVIHLFACHGIHKNGTQYVVLNEYDDDTEFYKLFAAEDKIRNFADTHPNSYQVSIFACCRDLFNAELMKGIPALSNVE